MIRRSVALAVFGVAALALGLGCGTNYNKVEVKVTMDDQPLADATVSFTSDTGASAAGQTDATGMCKLKSGTKEGVLPGSYTVTITKTERPQGEGMSKEDAMKKMMPKGIPAGGGGPGGPMPQGDLGTKFKSLIPAKYGDTKTSGFTCKVPEDTGSVKEFKLSSSSK